MGLSKTHEFSLADVSVANYAKALAHPARIAILRLLLERKACICGDIVEELPLSQSTVSQHLKELKEAGLIKGDISGTKICYCIDPQAWQQARQLLEGLFAQYRAGGTNCC
ncbi:MAG: ArsR/SmtB family transcription factor [Adhaeribacter sp.]